MKTSFTFKELLDAQPCLTEFTRLMSVLEVTYGTLETFTTLSPRSDGSLPVPSVHVKANVNDHLFTEFLNAPIGAHDVARAATIPDLNLCWCITNELLGDPSTHHSTCSPPHERAWMNDVIIESRVTHS